MQPPAWFQNVPSPQGESPHPLNRGSPRRAATAHRFLPVELLIPDPSEMESRAVGPRVRLFLLAWGFRGSPMGRGAGLTPLRGRVLFPGVGLLRRGRPRTSSRTPRWSYLLAAANEHQAWGGGVPVPLRTSPLLQWPPHPTSPPATLHPPAPTPSRRLSPPVFSVLGTTQGCPLTGAVIRLSRG